MSASPSKTVVVFGATGVQGTAFIKALSGYNTNPTSPAYTILALTRDSTSGSSTRLASLPGVQVKQVAKNCMDEPAKAFADAGVTKGGVYAVFSVQSYVSPKMDIAQGKAIADASVALGAERFIYASSDFGGLADTGLDMYESKRTVENHIRTLPITWTFLRPVQFMDNWLPDAPGTLKFGRTVLLKYGFRTHPERKHQLVSARDIGIAGATALNRSDVYANKEIPLAGDELTMDELEKVHQEVMGGPVETSMVALAWFARRYVPIARKVMDFFDEQGYHVDVAKLRDEFPGLEDFRARLKRYRAEKGE
ncbi:hypothetical protein EHS25_004445 [Saitozyma podzolica]|uniref:NmrA-like domain-containing protein n=1 Tax=Saitozyma podzolica TaxID=1890683 RepID=A0A427YUH1_9TREE|nr:hypothetical protein EHS25_004445 [Saitozyma podzolica]